MKSNKIRFISLQLIIIIGMYISALPAFSSQADSIGKVVAIRGKATAVPEGGKSRALFSKAPVFLGDTIRTQNGRLQMMFKDNTLVTLGRNSQMQITRYLWKPGDTSSAMETKVQEGSFRIMGGAITRIAPNNFKTQAPSGTIGIRGSMYAGKVNGDQLFVLFQGGKGIYVQNNAGVVEITRPGFGTQVKGAALPPEEPQKMGTDELQKFEDLLAQSPDEDATETDDSASQAEQSGPTEQSDQAGATDPPAEDSDTQASVASTDESGQLPESDAMGETPAPLEGGSVSGSADITSIARDATLSSAQGAVLSALEPDGVEGKIQLMLLEQGFKQTARSTTVPSNGIWHYKGDMTNTLNPEDDGHKMKFIVNWKSRRVIGFEDISSGASGPSDPKGSGFGFATIDASGRISNLKVLGSDAGPDMGAVMALTGSETFGHFYGATQGGLGLAMEGYDYNIKDQTQSQFWSDIAAAVLESKSATTYSGTASWSGFFVGVAENMDNPNTDRRVFYDKNDTSTINSTGFSLAINKDTGTFSGTLSCGTETDFNGSAYTISTIGIGGGAADSAYITDKILAAEITNATINLSTTLKPYGNFMVTANEPMLSNYTTWGYWEVAYEESDGDDYHLHVPGSRWIAGVQALLPASFVGTYQGGARGVMFDSTSQMQDLSGGSTTLNIDFTGVSTPVTGNITFDGGINLPVTTSSPSQLAAAGFNAEISGATTSSVSGAFFGPTVTGASSAGPAAVGGNFNAQMDGKQYHGIFAGNLQ